MSIWIFFWGIGMLTAGAGAGFAAGYARGKRRASKAAQALADMETSLFGKPLGDLDDDN